MYENKSPRSYYIYWNCTLYCGVLNGIKKYGKNLANFKLAKL